MRELTVRAFNEAYETATLVNGIIHFLNNSGWKGLLFLVMCLALIVGLICASRKISSPMYLIMAFFIPLALYMALIGTKVKLNIHDEYTMENFTLDNVPFGLAAPLSVSSHLEMGLTELIDDNVRPATDPSFFTVDFMGSARMISNVSNSNLYMVPHLSKTIAEYGRYCVIPAMAANDITYDQLQREPDLASYLNLGYQVYFSKIYDQLGGSQIGTCAAVYNWILNEMSVYTNLAYGSAFGNQVTSYMGRRGSNVALASATLAAGVSSMFSGFQDSSEQLFSQLFLINGLKNTLSLVDPTLGMSVAEAEQKQISAQTISGILNIKHLSKYRTFLKLFLIAIMPIVACFWYFNFGHAFFIWCGIFLWVSLFLPMEAAIHAVYTAGTLSELRNFIDPYGGYTVLTEPSVAKWATETNAMAANLMLGIFAFSALILKMSVPAAGQAVMSMLTATQNQTRFQSQASSNILDSAERRGVGMASDRAAELMAKKGQFRSALNMADHGQFGAHKSQMFGPNLWGQEVASTLSSGQALTALHGGNTVFSGTTSDESWAAAKSSLTDAFTKAKETANGYTSQSMWGASKQSLESFTNSIDKAFSKSGQALFTKGSNEIDSYVKSIATSHGWDEKQTQKVAVMAKASLGFSLMGNGIAFSGEEDSSKGVSKGKQASELSRADIQKMASDSVSSVMSHGSQIKGGLNHALSYNENEINSVSAQNMFSDMQKNINAISRAKSLEQGLRHSTGTRGQATVSATEIAGMAWDRNLYTKVRGDAYHVNQLLNQHGNNSAPIHALQAALHKDIREAFLRGGDKLANLSVAMRDAGFENADMLAALANSGQPVEMSINGKKVLMQSPSITPNIAPTPQPAANGGRGATLKTNSGVRGSNRGDAVSASSASASAAPVGTPPVPAAPASSPHQGGDHKAPGFIPPSPKAGSLIQVPTPPGASQVTAQTDKHLADVADPSIVTRMNREPTRAENFAVQKIANAMKDIETGRGNVDDGSGQVQRSGNAVRSASKTTNFLEGKPSEKIPIPITPHTPSVTRLIIGGRKNDNK